MSKKVTFEQAKKLKEIGFDYSDGIDQTYYHQNGELVTYQYWDYYNDCPDDPLDSDIPAPTVSEALDWIREENKIECGVYPFAEESKDEQNPIIIRYEYRFISYQRNPATKINDLFCKVATFDTHPLAESALLDAVLTYLEQKENK